MLKFCNKYFQQKFIHYAMRILYFSRDYGRVTTTFIRNEVEYFAGKYECMYLCQRSFVEGSQPAFVKVIPFKERIFNWLLRKLRVRFNFYSPQYSREIKRIVEEFNPDIIHCHFAAEAFMLLDNIDHKKYSVIVHFHGYDASQALRNPAYVLRLKALVRQANIFPVSCNEFFVGRLSQSLQVSKQRFFILPYGVDTDLFNRKAYSDIDRDKKVFLQISSLIPKKGHEYTLRAFALFLKKTGREDCRLVIAGSGPLRARLVGMVASLQLNNYVQFKGAVSVQEAVDLLGNADVFVHHSVTAPNGDMEGMPNSIIEAMAMKLPVISTFHSGIPELIADGVNGFLVNEYDVEGYALGMRKSLAAGLMPQNRVKVEQQYSLELHNQRLEKLYGLLFAVG